MKKRQFWLSVRNTVLGTLGSIMMVLTGCVTPEMQAQWREQALKEVRQYIDKEKYSRADKKLKESMWLFEGKKWENLVALCKVMNDCKKLLAKEEPDVEGCKQLWAQKPVCPDFPWPMWFSDKDIEAAEAALIPKTFEKGKFYQFKDTSGRYFVFSPVKDKEVAVLGWYLPDVLGGKPLSDSRYKLVESVSIPSNILGNKVVAIVGGDETSPWGREIITALKREISNAGKRGREDKLYWLCEFDHAASFCLERLRSITIPEGVRIITKGTFRGVWRLETVNLPTSLECIEAEAFVGSKNLTDVVFGEKLKSIGDEAFAGCEDLSAIVLPDSVTEVGVKSFSKCLKARKIRIGKGLKSVAKSAFIQSRGLEELEIAEGVMEIQQEAFRYSGVPVVKLPQSMKLIGEAAFADNGSLAEVDIGGTEVIGTEAFRHGGLGYGNLRKVSLNNVVKIMNLAFAGTHLMQVDLPGSVKYVGERAFACHYLATINSSPKATGIDPEAFKYTPWRKNVKGLIRIGDTVFGFNAERGAGPSAIVIPDGVRVIANGAGLGEAGGLNNGGPGALADVELPESLEIIGHHAFENASIREITLPAKLKEIGSHAFAGCPLSGIQFPSGLKGIGNRAFERCPLKSVVIPDSVKIIGEAAFEGNRKLTDAYLPQSLEKLERNVFAECVGLKKVSIPAAVKEIESSAFKECAMIEEVTMPADKITVSSLFAASSKSIKKICVQNGCECVLDAFAAALPALQEVQIPGSVNNIGASAFLKCSSLKIVSFEGRMPKSSAAIFKGTPADLNVVVKKDAGWQGPMFPVNGGDNARKVVAK